LYWELGWGGKEQVHNFVGQTCGDVVSQSTNEDVGDDMDMILSATIFLQFDLIQVCVVPALQHLTLTKVFVWRIVTSVGISL
jgi:hypothetical protein